MTLSPGFVIISILRFCFASSTNSLMFLKDSPFPGVSGKEGASGADKLLVVIV